MHARLSEGYYARPVVLDDADEIAALYDAESRWLNGVGESVQERAEEIRGEWGFAFINLETDTLAVFTADHCAVGYADFFDVRPPHVDLMGFAMVHPEHMQRGIGSFLADWLEERARTNLIKTPAEARVVLDQGIQDNNQSAINLLTGRGYCHVNNAYRMRIDFDGPPATPDIPEGIVIRGINGEEDERLALFAKYESFLDHRGAVEEPFEVYYARWKDILKNDKNHDPSLWFLAMDGDQPVGVAINYHFTEDDPEMGWVHTIGVRRPWRKRGLGLALLQTSFGALYARGNRRAGLGVDAASLTGATRLYERAGMRVERVFQSYELELRAGKELTRKSL